MTSREELVAPYIDAIDAIEGAIGLKDYTRRYNPLRSVHPSILPILGPLLADETFKPGIFLPMTVHLFGSKSSTELGITSLDKEAFERAGELEFRLSQPENEDLFAGAKDDQMGKLYGALRMTALISTPEEFPILIDNLHTAASLILTRGADHRALIAMLPTISRTPSLSSGAL